MTDAGADFVTARSELAEMLVLCVPALFPGLGSVVAEEMVAVLVRSVPGATDDKT
jgi:hypothetical protein